MKTKVFVIIIALFIGTRQGLFAQDIRDALLFGQSNLTGTARSLGMAGTSVALGADYGTVSINPAGIATATKSYLMISPSLQIIGSTSDYLGNSVSSSKSSFGLSNFGLISTANKPTDNSFKGLTLALGYNQIANSSVSIQAEGFNTKNSMSYFFASLANGIDFSTINQDDYYYTYIGWQAYLIDTLPGTTNQYRGVVDKDIYQEYSEDRKFRIGEWNLALAGNWDNRLFIGMGVGIQDISGKKEISLYEEDSKNLHQVYNPANGQYDFQSALFYETVRSSGVGINATLGVLFYPTDYFRLGFSLKSPTAISMKDVYAAALDPVKFDGGNPNTFSAQTNEFVSRYSVTSPYELNAGALLLIGKAGLIQADFNFKDYTQIRYNSRDAVAAFSGLNKLISNYFSQTYRIRIGGEMKLDNFYLRAGGGYVGGILSEQGKVYYDENGNKNTINPAQIIYSLGVGYKSRGVFFDLAMLHQARIEKFLPYSIDEQKYPTLTPVPAVVAKYGLNNVAFTIGFIID